MHQLFYELGIEHKADTSVTKFRNRKVEITSLGRVNKSRLLRG